MVTIQNQGIKHNGQTRYTIHINEEFMAEFWHKREDGLGGCLLEASKAVEKNKWESMGRYYQENRGG